MSAVYARGPLARSVAVAVALALGGLVLAPPGDAGAAHPASQHGATRATVAQAVSSPPATGVWHDSARSPSTPVTVLRQHGTPAGDGAPARATAGEGRAATVATNGSGAAHGTWSTLPSMPTPRSGFGAWASTTSESSTGPLLTIGGISTATGKPTSVVESLSRSEGTWTWQEDAALPEPVRLASATEDPYNFGIEVAAITGSPATDEQAVVFTCSGQEGFPCLTTTDGWTQQAQETLGHVDVTSITAVKLCKGYLYHCPTSAMAIHLGFLGCGAGEWLKEAPTPTHTQEPVITSHASVPGLPATKAGELVVPPSYEGGGSALGVGGDPASPTGGSCTATSTVTEDDPWSLPPAAAGWFSSPVPVNQTGGSPVVGAAEVWSPRDEPIPPTSTSRGTETEYFLASGPTPATQHASLYDVGSTPVNGAWESDPAAPVACPDGNCPRLEALVALEPYQPTSTALGTPLVLLTSDGTAAAFTPGGALTPTPTGTTAPATTQASLTVSLQKTTGATGTVVSTPPGIDCPGTCTAKFPFGHGVTLTATPGTTTVLFKGFTPAGWGTYTPNGLCPSGATVCTIPPSDLATANSVSAYFSPFVVRVAATAGPPTGTTLVTVDLSDCDFDVGTSTWTIVDSSHNVEAEFHHRTTCFVATTLPPGRYSVELSATDKQGTLVATDTATVTVKAYLEFQYYMGPSTGSPVKVVVNACKLSSGISSYHWLVTGSTPLTPFTFTPTPTTKGFRWTSTHTTWIESCGPLALHLTTGVRTVKLEGTDTHGNHASVSLPIGVVSYSTSKKQQQCSAVSIGATACWRDYAGWTADVLSGNARDPDFASLAVSGAFLGVGGDISVTLTCDGSWYAGSGVTESLGSADALSVQATAGWGWVGTPQGEEPLARDVDTFVNGTTFSVGLNLLDVGANFVVSPEAPGPQDGIFVYVSTPGVGITGEEGSSAPLGTHRTPGGSRCPPGGVIDTTAFQELANIPNLPNGGYPVVIPTAISPARIPGGGTQVYVTASHWSPGTKVSVHVGGRSGPTVRAALADASSTVTLGTAIADDTGKIGEPVKLPTLAPGSYQFVLSGYTAGGSPLTQTIAFTVGTAPTTGNAHTPPPPAAAGYDLVGSDGGVFVFNPPGVMTKGFYGSLPGIRVTPTKPVVGIVPTLSDTGYWLVGADGGVFAFHAPFLNSLPGIGVTPNLPIVGIVAADTDRGYFLVGADGGVYAFGTVPFLGSLPGTHISVSNVIGIAATPSGDGYWVVQATGTVHAFGQAKAFTTTATTSPVTAIAGTPTGGGYWLVTKEGGVYPYGNAAKKGAGTLPSVGVVPTLPVIGIVPTAGTSGYRLIGQDGGIFAFGTAPFYGSLPSVGVHVGDIVGAVPN